MESKQKSTSISHQILIKLLNGKHKTLNFTTPIVSIETLKQSIQTLTLIPSHLQLLTLSDSRILHDSQFLNVLPGSDSSGSGTEKCNGGSFPVVVHLLLRLRGGKGGFGSLLRGAATKAGQKKTNNFDACRDMSGRRLRHVNAEKKLEEWRAEAEERKLEKMAEEYIKKQAKQTGGKKAKRSDDAEKYVAKYREDSAKCMEEVERTVRESLKGFLAAKRKGAAVDGSESEAKRMKIWLGKRKIAGSDSEDTDEDDSDDDEEEENEESVVITDGNNSDSSKESERSPDSVTGTIRDIVSSDKGTSESGSEEEKDVITDESAKSGESTDDCAVHAEAKCVTEIAPQGSEERTAQVEGEFCLEAPVVSGSESLGQEKKVPNNIQQTVSQPPGISGSVEEDSSLAQIDVDANSKLFQEETVSTSPEVPNLEKPLNLDEYNSAAELEVLGLERLKSELQERGLKCGGTLQERAARLFLVKTTPLEKLPKKLFAKK